jgi:TetR/AcrR family transcriptional regulator
MLGANVMYFLSAPMYKLVMATEPFELEALAARRKALVEFLGQAIFQDRQHGAELAARIVADSPMPEIKGGRFTFGGKNERTE